MIIATATLRMTTSIRVWEMEVRAWAVAPLTRTDGGILGKLESGTTRHSIGIWRSQPSFSSFAFSFLFCFTRKHDNEYRDVLLMIDPICMLYLICKLLIALAPHLYTARPSHFSTRVTVTSRRRPRSDDLFIPCSAVRIHRPGATLSSRRSSRPVTAASSPRRLGPRLQTQPAARRACSPGCSGSPRGSRLLAPPCAC